ncbi:MAG: hypothetical protein EZS26_000746 [Candidatus Ordinivivax streblomastigis]|uniref:Uncharacterized protein n=1 Tax=Candidatus Ordinivivax streblomastigis TaxID=2540710 RepID=A0A5M8P3V5_9BACT|nr:MAG: hypothetical protein EZS26_000746 [Candidatus Ordinivivax streblomastigis]
MKQKEKVEVIKVFCKNCFFGGNIENHLIDCSNKQANPGGYKMGCWEIICKHYKQK